MGKIVEAVCLRNCADSRDYFERGRIYRIDLETHPCRTNFKLASEVVDPQNPGPPPSPGQLSPDRPRRIEMS